MAGPIAKVSKGLCKLSLAHCGLTAKGVNQIAHSLSLNQTIANSLTYLDLSGNNLKDDINVSTRTGLKNMNLLNISQTPLPLESLQLPSPAQCSGAFGHLCDGHNTGECEFKLIQLQEKRGHYFN